MHVTPYHKNRKGQIFLLGMFVGAIIAYIVLIFMYGKMYESIMTENIKLSSEIKELERRNEALLQDKVHLEERSFIIQSIEIHFSNAEELRMDRLIIHQLEDLIKNEISQVIGKEIDSVADNDELLITVIENKTFTIDDLSYEFEVQKMSISERLRLTLRASLTD